MIRLRTPRLVLDAPREGDIDAVFRACQDAQIHEWVPLPDPYTHESAEFFVRSYVPHGEASGAFTVWAVRLDDDPLIGVVEVRRDRAAGSASLGCWLAAPARGNGYMHEALSRVVEHALDPQGLGFSRLRWEYLLGNETSKHLAESVGFEFDPSTAHEVVFHGRMRHAVVGYLGSGGGGARRGRRG
ncbi:GNAT family N-acetyltransferase [Leifsonia sp. NPDC058248]|uniref:GNAT family N-acetyltransferase n=1 Tax=Leifsonia sp. NPDC058248 TaxID=3346402 RepID=UPI0036DB3E29